MVYVCIDFREVDVKFLQSMRAPSYQQTLLRKGQAAAASHKLIYDSRLCYHSILGSVLGSVRPSRRYKLIDTAKKYDFCTFLPGFCSIFRRPFETAVIA